MYIELPLTAKAMAGGDPEEVAKVLEEELESHASELVGGEHCESGGMPEGESVRITRFELDQRGAIAILRVSFNEVVASACRDFSYRHHREFSTSLTLPQDSDRAQIGAESDGDDTLDLWDRNSAADGT